MVERALAEAERHHRSGRVREAEAIFSDLLRRHGQDARALVKLAQSTARLGEMDVAADLFARAARLRPADAAIRNDLAVVLARLGRIDAAIEQLRQVTVLSPDLAAAHYNLGKALKQSGQSRAAIESYRLARDLDPGNADTAYNLANALSDLGRMDEALAAYRAALAIQPDFALAHSNLLLAAQYAPEATVAGLYAQHRTFEEAIGRPLARTWKPHANPPDPQRKLRVGLVSPDLARHPVGYFLVGLLPRLDPAAFEIHAYSNRAEEDDLSARLRAQCHAWTPTLALDDAALAKRIRGDGIDLLIDLAGHTARNRLPVFARKPAPVQITWAGYPGTTGLAAIDWIFADRIHIRPEEEAFYAERVLRFPHGWLIYEAPDYAPKVGPLPAAKSGRVTYASFNNPVKYSAACLGLWAAIVGETPGGHLLLKAQAFADPDIAGRVRAELEAAGLASARLTIETGVPHAELLDAYNRVDIALDPFPYSGGLTTLEALWMGVPVITMPGLSFAGRHSTSHLVNAGLADLVAADAQDYAARAVALAGDPPRLDHLRVGLRARLASSPVCDAAGFAQAFADLLRRTWREWCARHADQAGAR
jgi:protein O-GlcNAc transferase